MRLLSWNVQWCRGIDGVVDPARIAAGARAYDADVICLQELAANFPELAGSKGEDQPHALMHALPEYEGCLVSGVDVPAPNGRRSRFGNAILSRLPVGRVLRHSLPWPASEGPSMPRTAVEAVLEAPFGHVRVITTHLEYYSAKHRAAQIEHLEDIRREFDEEESISEANGAFKRLPRPKSVILCGDFNLRPEDPLHARILDAGFFDAWQALHPGEPHPHTFRVHEKDKEAPYCCDYVFVTEDLVPRLRAIRVDGANRASDHQPVIIDLE